MAADVPAPATDWSVDVGRVVVVALFSLSMIAAAGRAWTTAAAAGPALPTSLDVACTLLTAAFCLLVVRAYLGRRPASATDRDPAVWVAAPLATCLPFVLTLLPSAPPPTGTAVAALGLILAGTLWSVWSLRHLSTCLSVLPQARRLVDGGPYRLVRHPLYLGEIVAVAGFALRGGHWSHAVLTVALAAVQAYRARREEALLLAQVPGYAEYAARTWRILPGAY